MAGPPLEGGLPGGTVCSSVRMAGGTPRIAGPSGGGRGGCAGKDGPEDASPEASAPREPGMTWPGAVSRGISGCRLRGGPGGGVGLAAEKGQGGGEVGAAAGPRGVGAAAAAGGQAGHLTQLEHEPTGGGVRAAALGGAGQCSPGQLIPPPGPGLAFEPVAGRALVEDAGHAESLGGSIQGGVPATPPPVGVAADQAGGGEPIKQLEGARGGGAQGGGKLAGAGRLAGDGPGLVSDHDRPVDDHLVGAGGIMTQTGGSKGVMGSGGPPGGEVRTPGQKIRPGT